MERRRRNVSGDVDRIQVFGPVRIPPTQKDWDPIARDMYRSLRDSGQSLLYEPSDWQAARMAAIATTLMLTCPGSGSVLGNRHRAAGRCPSCDRPMEKDLEARFVRHRRATVRAEMLQAVWKMWLDLNITETARRRAHIEIERSLGEPAPVTQISGYLNLTEPTTFEGDDEDPDDDDD